MTIIHNKIHQYRKFIRFCIVGAICTFIDAAIFYLLHDSIGYKLAIIAGFSVSICINYLLNICWSFSQKPNSKNAIGMLAAHLFNIFIVRMSLMWFFMELLKISESISYIPTLTISIITNFIIVQFIVKWTHK